MDFHAPTYNQSLAFVEKISFYKVVSKGFLPNPRNEPYLLGDFAPFNFTSKFFQYLELKKKILCAKWQCTITSNSAYNFYSVLFSQSFCCCYCCALLLYYYCGKRIYVLCKKCHSSSGRVLVYIEKSTFVVLSHWMHTSKQTASR